MDKTSVEKNESIKIQYFKTAFGELILGSFKNQLCLADWRYRKMRASIDKRLRTDLNAEFTIINSSIIQETKTQLSQYFNRKRTQFDIPLLFAGTNFQKKVWGELLKIPYGTTQTYLGLSQKLNNEKAIRAVASANGANAISIIVPCHRIIGSNGKLVGYAGGVSTKLKLLTLENALNNKQLSLF